MKKMVLIFGLFVLMIVKLKSQKTNIEQIEDTLKLDKLAFDYLNKYRVAHRLRPLKWSNKIYKFSIHHSLEHVKQDNLFHSKTLGLEKGEFGYAGENCFYNTPICPLCYEGDTLFDEFVEVFLNEKLEEIKKDKYKFFAAYSIYVWATSPPHNTGMLTPEFEYGAMHVGYYNIRAAHINRNDEDNDVSNDKCGYCNYAYHAECQTGTINMIQYYNKKSNRKKKKRKGWIKKIYDYVNVKKDEQNNKSEVIDKNAYKNYLVYSADKKIHLEKDPLILKRYYEKKKSNEDKNKVYIIVKFY